MANETILCLECGKPMKWKWSQGSYSPGAWVISCGNAGHFAKNDGCYMFGASMRPDTYEQEFAQHRAMRVIHRAGAGIIYNNQEGTVEQWIAEAEQRGILPANWREWGRVKHNEP